ncbi:MAG TPA: hypothetical protein VKZ63_17495 [Kofleriaceae bacterium]|nr:hypothetical protein [Kofleriaceae bacterium]
MNTMLDYLLDDPSAVQAEPSTSPDEFKRLIKSSVRAGSCVSNPEGHCASSGSSCVSNPEGHCASGVGAGCRACGGGCSVGPGGSL